MAKKKQLYWILLGTVLFFTYVFLAARPVPGELLLEARWISSLSTGTAEAAIVDVAKSSSDGEPLCKPWIFWVRVIG